MPINIDVSGSRMKRELEQLLRSSLKATDASKLMKTCLARNNQDLCIKGIHYDLRTYRRVLCVGAGKAGAHMARGVEQVLERYLEGGMVIVKDGHGTATKKIRVMEARHPIPDQRGVHATREIVKLVQSLTKHDLLIVLLSGGASSLLCAPAPGLRLADKQRATNLLLRRGANIHELNAVRKHLSAIKGGQLAKATKAPILTIGISDVLGDDEATIGSGPTVPDSTTFREARAILNQYRIWDKVSEPVRKHIQAGIRGHRPDTGKMNRHKSFHRQFVTLANNRTAINGVAMEVKRLGYHLYILDAPLQGEARELGALFAEIARDIRLYGNPIPPPACLLAGGEPTVQIRGRGTGGRAQEFSLAAAHELVGLENIAVAGFGTDGTDGPTEVAGAMVDGMTIKRAQQIGIDPFKMLQTHNSYHFFKTVGGHIRTGPTGTNVNDIYLALVR